MIRPTLLILIIIMGCNLGKEDVASVEEEVVVVAAIKTSSKVSREEGVSFEVVEGKTERCLSPSHMLTSWLSKCSTCYINWIKTKPVEVKSWKGNVHLMI